MPVQCFGTKFVSRIPLHVITNDDPLNPKPGFGWEISSEAQQAIKELENNMRVARLNAAQIVVD